MADVKSQMLTCTRLTVLLAIGSLTIGKIQGQDEYMTCSRPVKSYRSSRQHVPLPCDTMDNGKESWCTLPGPLYPWHSVRRFVFENQGLMRRMYGEVRQLSLLRMEFSGESNTLEESRDFGDLLQPITTFDPTLTLSSYMTTESIPTLVVTSGGDEGVNSTLNSTTTDRSVSEGESGAVRSSQFEDSDPLTTIADLMTTTESEVVGSGAMEKEGGESVLADGGVTEEPFPPQTTLGSTEEEAQNKGGVGSFEGNQEILAPDSPQMNPPPPEDAEKNRNEGQVLFQDFEKSTTTTTTEEPRIRTTNRQGVNACPVKEEVVAPYWANNTRGEILALLNLYPFEQYIHWEKCTNEHRQMYCRDGCRCEQQYRLHRLLAFDPQNECRGIFSDWFRFPSCCVCKCYFDDAVPERVSFNRSPRLFSDDLNLDSSIFSPHLDIDGPDVNGVDDSHFFYKLTHRHVRVNSFRRVMAGEDILLRESKIVEKVKRFRFLLGDLLLPLPEIFPSWRIPQDSKMKMDPKNQYQDVYQTEDEMMGAAGMSRKRVPQAHSDDIHSHPGVYEELETLRNLVDEFDGDRPGCTKGTVDGSLMSTVFGIVLVMILSISVYAFTNLYKAVMRKFYKDDQ